MSDDRLALEKAYRVSHLLGTIENALTDIEALGGSRAAALKELFAGIPFPEGHAGVFDAVRDLLWRATPNGETEDGDIAFYLLTKGTVHRLVGAMIAAGESAPLRNLSWAPVVDTEAEPPLTDAEWEPYAKAIGADTEADRG